MVPDTQVLKIGQYHTELATALGVKKFMVGGSEDLAVECRIFIVFLTLRANIPHKTRSAYITFSLMFLILPSTWDVVQPWWK